MYRMVSSLTLRSFERCPTDINIHVTKNVRMMAAWKLYCTGEDLSLLNFVYGILLYDSDRYIPTPAPCEDPATLGKFATERSHHPPCRRLSHYSILLSRAR